LNVKIAKVIDKNGREIFAEVVMIGRVLFDSRPGWVLLSSPLDKPARKRDVEWQHPDDVRFVWVRDFTFQ
jgi:GH15 family glucan-1,4-alpha-glucosidase